MLHKKNQIFNLKSMVPQAHTGGVLATRNTHTHSNTIFKSLLFLYAITFLILIIIAVLVSFG